jgi:hypothetical protein
MERRPTPRARSMGGRTERLLVAVGERVVLAAEVRVVAHLTPGGKVQGAREYARACQGEKDRVRRLQVGAHEYAREGGRKRSGRVWWRVEGEAWGGSNGGAGLKARPGTDERRRQMQQGATRCAYEHAPRGHANDAGGSGVVRGAGEDVELLRCAVCGGDVGGGGACVGHGAGPKVALLP